MKSVVAKAARAHAIPAAVAALLLVSGAPLAEDYGDWGHWMDIYLNTTGSGADVDDTLVSSPVLLRLDGAPFPFDKVDGLGDDIWFATE
jgi:hypothetical protein